MASSSSDLLILGAGVSLAALYLFRSSIFPSKPAAAPVNHKSIDSDGNPRDFVAKMKAGKKRLAIFYGSQTGTAEEYAIRLAKEAKSRYGLASLVCDPEEYDFDNMDEVPENCAVIFVMATYGEGEPTDNSVQLMQNLEDSSFEFSKGEHRLEGLKYVLFGLGNRTYEKYNEIALRVDKSLEGMGAKRIGTVGLGDDDKSMEEDYLEWKETMWPAFAEEMGVEEGQGGDTPDFVVTELASHAPEKVYLGELSARALTKTKGIHDAKNPYAAPITKSRDLFSVDGERNCVHLEVSIEGSGITYQHGDHVGVWPTNPDLEVKRLLCVLGLGTPERRTSVIGIESLDPALAKVPFPVPTTYETVLRHYIDISTVASRQLLGMLAKHAPTPEAEQQLKALSNDKDAYASIVGGGCLKLGEVLQLVAGNNISADPTPENTTAWKIPFDTIVSGVPRLMPRYYSISSSPKLNPGSIHITAVVLKYQSIASSNVPSKWVYGVSTNLIYNLMKAHAGEPVPINASSSDSQPNRVAFPLYTIDGPRGAYKQETLVKVPIHVRRSTFRLPTNPKTPVIMIGPGTGVAPFRGFVQERVALAKRTIERNGPEGIAEWAPMVLFYGCRSSKEDYLYSDEWPQYQQVLGSKFAMHTAFSRDGKRKPDGSKIYVQDLLWDDRENVAEFIGKQKGYIYVCGDAKSMAKAVEEVLVKILGLEEFKSLKDKGKYLSDVWS